MVFSNCNIADNTPDGVWMGYGRVQINEEVRVWGNDWVGTKLVTSLGLETDPGLTFEVYLLAVALAGGLVVAFINRLLFSEEVVAED